MELAAAIPVVRESVVAVFRYGPVPGNAGPAQYKVGWGTGFCIARDRYVVTACHVLNDGKPRNPSDRFIVFVVPGNGNAAFHFPVVGFPLERPEMDLAILEIGPCDTPGVHLPSIPISFGAPRDGSRVLTLGFPAPEIIGLSIDPQGNYRGGQFFLKSHANEGMVSAQYPMGPLHMFEFNVGWHHGESGGPVVRLDDPIAAFTVMQQYRNIQSPHGTLAGPHRGCALSSIRAEIESLGAKIV